MKCFELLVALVVFSGKFEISDSCEGSIPATDRCFQVFVERDLPVIEEFIKWNMDSGRQNRGRAIIIDGPELDIHCGHIKDMSSCYTRAVKYFCAGVHYHTFELTGLIHESIDILCEKPSQGIKVLINKFPCIDQVRTKYCYMKELDPLPWRSIIRMELWKQPVCESLQKQRNCLLNESPLNKTCGKAVYDFVERATSTWAITWCNASIRLSSNAVLVFLTFLYSIHSFS